MEEDLYYNGVNATAFARLNNNPEIAHADAMLNTGAFMTNAVLRFAPNSGCGFQPYIFGGIGGWWGETGGDIDVTVGNVTRSFGSRDNGGFAFQVGVGADYSFRRSGASSPNTSFSITQMRVTSSQIPMLINIWSVAV